jgi:hypothetical protein
MKIINYNVITENLGCYSKIPLNITGSGPKFNTTLFSAPKAHIWGGKIFFFKGDGYTREADVNDFLLTAMGPDKANAIICPGISNIFSPEGEKFIQSNPANTGFGNGRFLIFNQNHIQGAMGMFFKMENNNTYTANLLWAGFPPSDKILSYEFNTCNRYTTIKTTILESESGRRIKVSTGGSLNIFNNGEVAIFESTKSKGAF